MATGIRLVLLTVAFVAASIADAAVVTWTVDGAFTDGGVAKGFFTLTDTPGIELSDYAIQVSGGDFPDFEYTPATAPLDFLSPTYFVLGPMGARSMGLAFFPGVLWDQNDTLTCCVTYLLDSTISFEGTPPSPIRLFSFGSSVASVPEPSTYALVLVGLASIAALARRRMRR